MKPHLLQIGPFPEFAQTMIDAEYQCHDWEAVYTDSGLKTQIRGIVTRSNFDIPADTVKQLPNLGVIATCGVGYDLIPLELTRQRGILVANTPDVLSNAVAELALGLILSLLRRLPEAHQFMKSSQWLQSAFPLGSDLAGKKVGIIGMGRIGKEIARRLAGFDVTITYHGRTDQNIGLRFEPDVTTLAADSDILILAAPGGADTANLIDHAVLTALGPKGYLINISRGSLIDEDALITALDTRSIAGAALDVFNNEPAIDPRFLALDNVILTPHIGSAAYETRLNMVRLTLENLRQFFRGGTVLTPVSI